MLQDTYPYHNYTTFTYSHQIGYQVQPPKLGGQQVSPLRVTDPSRNYNEKTALPKYSINVAPGLIG